MTYAGYDRRYYNLVTQTYESINTVHYNLSPEHPGLSLTLASNRCHHASVY
jgi:hypothetical protein